jgi:hypothetical protein
VIPKTVLPRLALAGALAVHLALASAACGQAPGAWPKFRDGSVEVSHPPGWRAQRDPDTGRLLVMGPRGERLIVWPFWVDGALDPSTAANVLARMAGRQSPQTAWGRIQPAGRTGMRVDGRNGADSVVSVLTWTPTPRGAAAQFVLASAASNLRRESETAFAAILASVRFTGAQNAGGGPAVPRVAFVRFQEPNESAFSLEVPQGWRVNGGLVRKAPVDIRSQVVASSPDNQVHLRLGDADLPAFTLPTALLAQGGFREGAWYSPGYGVNMQVLRYLGGEQFAAHWVNTRVAPSCGGLQVVSTRPLPQTVQALNEIMARYGTPYVAQRLHAGDVAYRCQQGAAPMLGYLFASTIVTATADGAGTWSVDQLQGYHAAAARAAEAESLLARMVGSFQLNPAWVQMQQNITRNVSGIVADTNAHISRVISEGYWSRQSTLDELSRRRSNQILGVEDVRDPVTGRELQVSSGSNYYWIDPRGNIAGTNVDQRPKLDFRELIRLP